MKKLALLSSLVFLFASCQQNLKSESSLYNVQLKHNPKVLVDGIWSWGKGNPYAGQKSGSIYIHPLDVSLVRRAYPQESKLMVIQMQDYLVQAIAKELKAINAANHCHWVLTTNPSAADICIKTAIVKFKPQKPSLKAASAVGSVVMSMPGVNHILGSIADGDIRIEGTMRDARSGQLLLAFKDSNRKKVRIYTEEAYRATGNADANLKEWAGNIAKVIRMSAYDKMGNGTLKEKVKQRSYFNVFSQSVADRI
jgi:hypothetical protein